MPTHEPTRDKARLRAELTTARRGRSTAAVSAAREAIRARVIAEQTRRCWGCVAAYVPLPGEPGSPELLDDLTSAGVRVLVPTLLHDRDLGWTVWDPGRPVDWQGTPCRQPLLPTCANDGPTCANDGGQVEADFNVAVNRDVARKADSRDAEGTCDAEPARDADVTAAGAVLVPALAVSRDGVRLGRGGGSYDRALARVRAGTTIAAVLFDEEIRDWLPADSWDIPVTAVVTPSGWHELRIP